MLLLRGITLAGFLLAVLSGLLGSPVGSVNFAIIVVWIAWWTLLKLVFIPVGGRAWCAVCPIPLPGEWLSQGGILPTGARRGLALRWPRKLGRLPLDGAWLQAGAFLLVGLVAAVTLTSPRLTGWALLGLFVLATVLAVVFGAKPGAAGGDRRPFCTHLCPIGGFTGLYAGAAPVEVRVEDPSICAAHTEKTCYSACPWGVYVAAQRDNSACGMCMECLRACPHDNVRLRLRPPAADLQHTPSAPARPGLLAVRMPRLDETYLALVMLGCALAFSAVFLGPWGALRRAAYAVGSLEWMVYAAVYLGLVGLALPGLWALAVRLGAGRSGEGFSRKEVARFARPLLPLGLCAWMAFTVSFALAKLSYVLPALADPFGIGRPLFAAPALTIDLSTPAALIQAGLLLGGMVWAGRVAQRDSDTPRRALAVQVFSLVYTLALMALLLG
jgi:polyferredoxin